MNQADLLEWLTEIIGSDTITVEDLKTGFPLLQLLSLISPTSVDLTWNTTPEALDCPNISLRNYSKVSLTTVSLAKGLKHLKQTPPPDMASNSEGLENIKAEISAISETVIHDAKSGQVEACVGILKIMYNIYRIAKIDQPQYSSKAIATEAKVEHEDNYVPSDRSFYPMVRWLLQKTAVSLQNSNFNPNLRVELQNALDSCSGQSAKIIPQKVLRILSSCTVYNYLNYMELEGESFNFPQSFSAVETITTLGPFLNNLISLGFLPNDESIQKSFEEKLCDGETFYESIHSKIIDAFIQATTSSLEIETIADYLDRAFPNFDKLSTFPYDLEDSFLIWMNSCLEELKLEKIVEIQDDIVEYEELNFAVNDGWLMALVLGIYTISDRETLTSICKPLVCKSNISSTERLSNYQILEKISGMNQDQTNISIPWLASEIERGPNDLHSANFTSLFKVFLHNLIKWVLKNDKPFLSPIAKTDVQLDEADQFAFTEVIPEKQKEGGVTEEIVDVDQELLESQERLVDIKQIPEADKEQSLADKVVDLSQESITALERFEEPGKEKEQDLDGMLEALISEYLPIEQESDLISMLENVPIEIPGSINASEVRLNEAQEENDDCQKGSTADYCFQEEDFFDTLQKSLDLLNAATQSDRTPRRRREILPQVTRRPEVPSHARLGDRTTPYQKQNTENAQESEISMERIKLTPSITSPGDKYFSNFPPNTLSAANGFDSAVDLSCKDEKHITEIQETLTAVRPSGKMNVIQNPTISEEYEDEANRKSSVLKDGGSIEFDLLKFYDTVEKEETASKVSEKEDLVHEGLDEPIEDEDWLIQGYTAEKTCQQNGEVSSHMKSEETYDGLDSTKPTENCDFLFEEQLDEEDSVVEQVQKMIRRQSIAISSAELVTNETVIIVDNNENSSTKGSIQEGKCSAPQSRPRTGLLSYPIPETEDELVEIGQLFDTNCSDKSISLAKNHETIPKVGAFRPQKVTKVSTSEIETKKRLRAEAHEKLLKAKEQQRKTSPKLVRPPTSSYQKLNLLTAATPKSSRSLLPAKSNKTIVKNALMHVSLAGKLNQARSTEVLKVLDVLIQDLADSKAGHFIILFREVNNFSFRGLYFWDHNLDQTLKLYSGCIGPTEIVPRAVLEFYKYDSGARTFRRIPTKSFGKSVDAVAIGREYFLPH